MKARLLKKFRKLAERNILLVGYTFKDKIWYKIRFVDEYIDDMDVSPLSTRIATEVNYRKAYISYCRKNCSYDVALESLNYHRESYIKYLVFRMRYKHNKFREQKPTIFDV